MISEINTPNVVESWLKTPHSPRRDIGAISDRYMGAKPVLIPIIESNEHSYEAFRPFVKAEGCVIKNHFSYFSTKIDV